MAHWGDPFEDLAWSLDPRQSVDQPEFAGGLAPNGGAIVAWQEASGLEINPQALRW